MSGNKNAIGDLQKPRLSLIPKEALWALGKALTVGEKKYGTHNWRQGIKLSYLLDASLRHINQFNAGENIDEDTQNHHLGNAMANLAMAIELHLTRPDLDDRHHDKKKTTKSGNIGSRTAERPKPRAKKRKQKS